MGRPSPMGPRSLESAAALHALDIAGCRLSRTIGGDGVHRRNFHDGLAGSLPGSLHDPRERPILSSRLGLDLAQHVFGKIETLLPLVRWSHLSRYRCKVGARGSAAGDFARRAPGCAESASNAETACWFEDLSSMDQALTREREAAPSPLACGAVRASCRGSVTRSRGCAPRPPSFERAPGGC
jgi:hypothetical protein